MNFKEIFREKLFLWSDHHCKMNFTTELLLWYQQHKRDLPWRQTRDPYLIWLSEIILQQTRIEQGLPYYHRFIHAFPSVYHLAAASEQQVLKLWQGLGYYSRARNLHVSAKEIVDKYHGKFPSAYPDIVRLKGIGSYTAAAIASIAFNVPVAVVDGNVLRFLSRYSGFRDPVDSGAAVKAIRSIASERMDTEDPGSFNQAMMEFGAKQCIPRNPDCCRCVFRKECFAFNHQMVEQLPVKKKKPTQVNRYFYYFLIHVKGKAGFYLMKRKENDIWKNLFTFPCIETSRHCSLEKLMSEIEWQHIFGIQIPKVMKKSKPYKHILTHQLITARFFELEIEKPLDHDFDYAEPSSLDQYPFPRLIEKYLQQNIDSESISSS